MESNTNNKKSPVEETFKRPAWVKKGVIEDDLCPDCFKVVGVKSRYKLVCILGKAKDGATVGSLTKQLDLQQPTITHHLNILKSVDAVDCRKNGRECIYTLNRGAHCFDECKIPY